MYLRDKHVPAQQTSPSMKTCGFAKPEQSVGGGSSRYSHVQVLHRGKNALDSKLGGLQSGHHIIVPRYHKKPWWVFCWLIGLILISHCSDLSERRWCSMMLFCVKSSKIIVVVWEMKC